MCSIDISIFRIEIKGTGPRGAKRAIYNKIKQLVNKHAVYRTYDYKEAKKSSVFLHNALLKYPGPLIFEYLCLLYFICWNVTCYTIGLIVEKKY